MMAISLAMSAQATFAQKDVTSTYLTNAGFETDAADDQNAVIPTGWTQAQATGDYTSAKVINNTTTPNNSLNIGNGVTQGAAEGEKYLYMRTNWGTGVLELTQTMSALPAGHYTLKADVLQPYTTTGMPTFTLGVSGAAEASTSVKSEAPIWRTVSVEFDVATEGDVIVSLLQNTGTGANAGCLTCVDNIRLLQGEASETTDVEYVTPSNTDFTSYITNASLETATDGTVYMTQGNAWNNKTPKGWSIARTGGTGGFNATTNTKDAKTGNAYEVWGSDATNTAMVLFQSINSLPAGKYTLQAYLNGAENAVTGKVFAKVGNNEFISNGGTTAGDYSVTFVKENAEDFLVIGAENQAQWIVVDEFTLTCEGIDASKLKDALQAKIDECADYSDATPMSAEARSALATAKAAGETALDATTADDILTATADLTTALEAAKASVETYKAAADVLAKMKDLTESTNFYTEDALNTYYTQWQTKYDEGTLTTDEANALQDPTIANYNTRDSRGMAPIFLLSTWDDGAENTNTSVDFSKGYYINTWSTEGINDGSNMTVPFFEYWVLNENALTARTLTGTLTGLEANTAYNISALVRVHVQNDGTEGSGVTMQVNDGEAVDVCTGTACSNNGYYYGTYTAAGKTDAAGNLVLKFIVADGNNISWLSFKDVNYAKATVVELDETAKEFTAEVDNYGTLTRTVKANKWNTLCVPFDIADASTLGTVKELSSVSTDADNNTELTFVDATSVKAGQVYLLKTDKESVAIEGRIAVTAPVENTIDGVTMKGSFVQTAVPTGSYFINNDMFYLVGDDASITMNGYRAYVTVASADGAKNLLINIDGETNSIKSVLDGADSDKTVDVYTLSGVKVKSGVKAGNAMSGLQRGMYIINGKKVIK